MRRVLRAVVVLAVAVVAGLVGWMVVTPSAERSKAQPAAGADSRLCTG